MAYASRCLSLERIPRSLAFPGGAGAFLCLPCGGRSVRCLRCGAGRVAWVAPRGSGPARPSMRFTFEAASRVARPVARRLLQGCPKISPPSTSSLESTPGGAGSNIAVRACAAFGEVLPSSLARSAHVVSHHRDGFLLPRPVGLLHPTADPGVHRVSTWCPRSAGHSRLLTDASRPPELSPPAAPYASSPTRRGHLAVLGERPARCWPRSTSWRCSLRASVASADVSAGECPMLSWASLPGTSRLLRWLSALSGCPARRRPAASTARCVPVGSRRRSRVIVSSACSVSHRAMPRPAPSFGLTLRWTCPPLRPLRIAAPRDLPPWCPGPARRPPRSRVTCSLPLGRARKPQPTAPSQGSSLPRVPAPHSGRPESSTAPSAPLAGFGRLHRAPRPDRRPSVAR